MLCRQIYKIRSYLNITYSTVLLLEFLRITGDRIYFKHMGTNVESKMYQPKRIQSRVLYNLPTNNIHKKNKIKMRIK